VERVESEDGTLRPGLAQTDRRFFTLAGALALLTLLIHLATNRQYGYFRDELYFIACSNHLAWGFPDQPPLAAFILWISRHAFGESLAAIRLLPAFSGAAKVLLTCLIARELGGGKWAAALAGLAVIVAPVYLIMDTFYSMNTFEPLFWMGAAWMVLRMTRSGNMKLWWAAGTLVGLGLLDKHTTGFFALSAIAGLLLSAQRRLLRSPHFFGGLSLALLIVLPHVLWQARNGWAMLETMETVRQTHKNIELPPLAFIGQQMQMLLPSAPLLWLVGLWWAFRKDGRPFRWIGFAFVVFFLMMMALHAKDYYLAPIYPMMLAAGAVWWETALRRWVWPKVAFMAVMLVLGALAAPIALPILPPDRLVAYMDRMNLHPPKSETHHRSALPQHFSDQFGWPEMVERVARIYYALPPEERAVAGIYAGNYGEAGAIDFFGPRYGLPKAISGHNAYWIWGPRDVSGKVLIVLQGSRAGLAQSCASVEDAGPTGHPFGMGEENYEIYICRGLRLPAQVIWPRLKHYN
jgi:hypothetical protein